jgi:hypothetical protein
MLLIFTERFFSEHTLVGGYFLNDIFTKRFKMNYDTLFSSLDKERNNFIARTLGIFSEHLVHFWTANNKCEFENIGRPDIFDKNCKKVAQLDFTLKNRETGKFYIVELKNLVAYNNGRIRNMTNEDSFNRSFKSWHTSKTNQTPAWKIFSGKLDDYTVKVKGKPLPEFGKILIWAKINAETKSHFCSTLSIDEILSFEQIHTDLISWKDNSYIEWLNNRIAWTNELFA